LAERPAVRRRAPEARAGDIPGPAGHRSGPQAGLGPGPPRLHGRRDADGAGPRRVRLRRRPRGSAGRRRSVHGPAEGRGRVVQGPLDAGADAHGTDAGAKILRHREPRGAGEDEIAGVRVTAPTNFDPKAFYTAGYAVEDPAEAAKLGRWRALGAR